MAASVIPSTRTAIIVSVIFAALVGLAFYGQHLVRTVEASRTLVAKKRAVLDEAIRRLEAAIAADTRKAGTPAAARNDSPWRLTADNGAVYAPPEPKAVIAPSHKILALLSATYRAGLAQTYGPLYQALGLTPAQIGAFENLLTAHRSDLRDLSIVASESDLGDSGPEIASLRQEENDKFRAALVALLGPAGFQQFEQIKRIMPVRTFVENLKLGNGLPTETIAGAQVQQLSSVLADASPSYRSGGAADPATVDWDAALPRAEGILSPTQFAALKASIDSIELDRDRKQFFQREQESQTP